MEDRGQRTEDGGAEDGLTEGGGEVGDLKPEG
jgi:hypothetical protein